MAKNMFLWYSLHYRFGGIMFAVEGIYDGNVITVKQPVPYQEAYDVVVTFLKPVTHQNSTMVVKTAIDDTEAEKQKRIKEKMDALNSLVGIIKGADVSIEDARNDRLARQ
ncbi:hypothetical protein ACYULU_10650 [Breznakiellaceae bacterium SP9]